MPGSGASIATHRLTRSRWVAATACRSRHQAWARGPTHPVGRDNRVVFDECARQMTPHAARCAEAVQHDDRWTMPADAHVDLGAVGFDLTRLHTGREGVDAVLMSVVVHRFTPRFQGNRSAISVAPGLPRRTR